MITPTFKLETELLAAGYKLIAGIDEAGRGPWAGPIVAGAVVIADPALFVHDRVRDSKMLSAKARLELSDWIKANAVAWAVGEVPSEELDSIGLQMANKTAMKRAIEKLEPRPDFILTDYVGRIEFRTPFKAIIGGDRTSMVIAAASIIAKTYRDEQMEQFALVYPEYGFELHKGYGTKLHQDMLVKHGLCPIHRRSFRPVAAVAKRSAKG